MSVLPSKQKCPRCHEPFEDDSEKCRLCNLPRPPLSTEPRDMLQKSIEPTCSDCGSIMSRNGGCYECRNCKKPARA